MLTSIMPAEIAARILENPYGGRSTSRSGLGTLWVMLFATACGGRAEQSSIAPAAPAAVETDGTVMAEQTPAAAEPPTDNRPSAPPDSTPAAPAPIDNIATPPGQAPPNQADPGQQPATPHPTPPPERLIIEGCAVVGGYDRVFIFQRDASTGICTDFGLVSPDDDAPAQPSLSLPERWAVEDMSSFDCALDGSPVNGATPTYFTRADGSIAFGGSEGGLPLHVQLEVVLSVPAEDVGTAAGQVISQQRLEAEDIDLSAGCSLRD